MKRISIIRMGVVLITTSCLLFVCCNQSDPRVINATDVQLQTLKDIESEYVGKTTIDESDTLGIKVDTLK